MPNHFLFALKLLFAHYCNSKKNNLFSLSNLTLKQLVAINFRQLTSSLHIIDSASTSNERDVTEHRRSLLWSPFTPRIIFLWPIFKHCPAKVPAKLFQKSNYNIALPRVQTMLLNKNLFNSLIRTSGN